MNAARLIADVVTGKLDVREAAARLPGEARPILRKTTSTSAMSLNPPTRTPVAFVAPEYLVGLVEFTSCRAKPGGRVQVNNGDPQRSAVPIRWRTAALNGKANAYWSGASDQSIHHQLALRGQQEGNEAGRLLRLLTPKLTFD